MKIKKYLDKPENLYLNYMYLFKMTKVSRKDITSKTNVCLSYPVLGYALLYWVILIDNMELKYLIPKDFMKNLKFELISKYRYNLPYVIYFINDSLIYLSWMLKFIQLNNFG